jgi:hypothetical protein
MLSEDAQHLLYRKISLKLCEFFRRAFFANKAVLIYSQIHYRVKAPKLPTSSSAPKLRYGPV